jgi:hypothetical protein
LQQKARVLVFFQAICLLPTLKLWHSKVFHSVGPEAVFATLEFLQNLGTGPIKAPGLTHKYQTRLERLGHSKNNEEKKGFLALTPVNVTKPFFLANDVAVNMGDFSWQSNICE